MKKLSVIVPVYNVEAYLRQCIDSIVGQTYRDLEIILVNDGSTDRSGDICDEYVARDPRIKVLHKANGGLSSARNAGMDVMTGDYVLFVDSDDWLDPNACEELMLQLVEHDADAIHFGFIKEYESGQSYAQAIAEQPVITSPEKTLEMYAARELEPMMCMYIYEVSSLGTLRCQEGKIHEDEFFNLEYFASAPRKVVISDGLYYHYRIRESSITTSKRSARNVVDCAEGFTLAMRRIKEQASDRQVLALCNYVVLNRLEASHVMNFEADVEMQGYMDSLCKVLAYSRTFPLPRKAPRVVEYRCFRAMPRFYPFVSGRRFARLLSFVYQKLGLA